MTAREYVISQPTGFQLAAGRFRAQLRDLHNDPDLNLLDAIHEDADKLVSLTPEQAAQLKARRPGLIIEPNILYYPFRHPYLDGFGEILLPLSNATKTVTVRVVDETTNAPVAGAEVYLIVDLAQRIGFRGTTDANGVCTITTRSETRNFAAVIALAPRTYWSRRWSDVVIDDAFTAKVQKLPALNGPCYDWGPTFAAMADGLGNSGNGVTVGVIDTGIVNDHPGLKPSGGRNCVSGEAEDMWHADADGHGTHCAGVVAAVVAAGANGTKGYVPQVNLRAYRVFGANAGGASTFDIAKAIQRAVEDGCDILSMSLGSASPQATLRTKTELAYDQGVLCVAATGNDGRHAVSYPAAFATVVGVGAFGKFGTYPADSLHAMTESTTRSTDGQYFVADFSNYGDQVDFCAPGVAITSTLPAGSYGAMDGTSMACPQVTGIAALTLAHSEAIRNMPRDSARVDALLQLMKSRAQPLGFGALYEGVGCLNIPKLLA